MRLASREKVIKEVKKAKTPFLFGAVAAMIISMGFIYFTELLKNHFAVKTGSLFLPIIICGWFFGACAAVAALTVSRCSRGKVVFTNRRLLNEGVTAKQNWSISNKDIVSVKTNKGKVEKIFGCISLVIIYKMSKLSYGSKKIGPFSKNTAEDLKYQLNRMLEKSGKRHLKCM